MNIFYQVFKIHFFLLLFFYCYYLFATQIKFFFRVFTTKKLFLTKLGNRYIILVLILITVAQHRGGGIRVQTSLGTYNSNKVLHNIFIKLKLIFSNLDYVGT